MEEMSSARATAIGRGRDVEPTLSCAGPASEKWALRPATIDATRGNRTPPVKRRVQRPRTGSRGNAPGAATMRHPLERMPEVNTALIGRNGSPGADRSRSMRKPGEIPTPHSSWRQTTLTAAGGAAIPARRIPETGCRWTQRVGGGPPFEGRFARGGSRRNSALGMLTPIEVETRQTPTTAA